MHVILFLELVMEAWAIYSHLLLMQLSMQLLEREIKHVWISLYLNLCVSEKKGPKAVTGAVPFQRVDFCT